MTSAHLSLAASRELPETPVQRLSRLTAETRLTGGEVVRNIVALSRQLSAAMDEAAAAGNAIPPGARELFTREAPRLSANAESLEVIALRFAS